MTDRGIDERLRVPTRSFLALLVVLSKRLLTALFGGSMNQITQEMIDQREIFAEAYGLLHDEADGNERDPAPDQTPDFYDVVVWRRYPGGDSEIEAHEDLSHAQFQERIRDVRERFPNISIEMV